MQERGCVADLPRLRRGAGITHSGSTGRCPGCSPPDTWRTWWRSQRHTWRSWQPCTPALRSANRGRRVESSGPRACGSPPLVLVWAAPQPRTAGRVYPGVAGLARAGAVGHHRVGAAAIDAIAHGHVVGVACARAVCKRVRACVHAQVSPLGGGGVLQGTLIF